RLSSSSAWVRTSSKVMVTPLDAGAACKRQCGNGTGRSSAFIPHRGAKGKPAVPGARDAAVALLSQPRGRRCHGCVDILHPASTLTQYRSTPCPHTSERLLATFRKVLAFPIRDDNKHSWTFPANTP